MTSGRRSGCGLLLCSEDSGAPTSLPVLRGCAASPGIRGTLHLHGRPGHPEWPLAFRASEGSWGPAPVTRVTTRPCVFLPSDLRVRYHRAAAAPPRVRRWGVHAFTPAPRQRGRRRPGFPGFPRGAAAGLGGRSGRRSASPCSRESIGSTGLDGCRVAWPLARSGGSTTAAGPLGRHAAADPEGLPQRPLHQLHLLRLLLRRHVFL